MTKIMGEVVQGVSKLEKMTCDDMQFPGLYGEFSLRKIIRLHRDKYSYKFLYKQN